MTDKNLKVIKYGNKMRQSIDIYQQSDVGLYPVIVVNIGSSFIFGSKLFSHPLCYFLQKNGYLVFSIDYSRLPFSDINHFRN